MIQLQIIVLIVRDLIAYQVVQLLNVAMNSLAHIDRILNKVQRQLQRVVAVRVDLLLVRHIQRPVNRQIGLQLGLGSVLQARRHALIVQQPICVRALHHLNHDWRQLAIQRQQTLGERSGRRLDAALVGRVNLQVVAISAVQAEKSGV